MQKLASRSMNSPCWAVVRPCKCAALTTADELPFLDLRHVVPPQVGRAHALGVEADARPLPQPVGQPGQVAVTVKVVGVKATAWEEAWPYG